MERNKTVVNTAMRAKAIRYTKSKRLFAPLWGYKVEEGRIDEGFYKQFTNTVNYKHTLTQALYA